MDAMTEIGQGSFGTVYKMRHVSNNNYFAVKQVSVENPEDLERVLSEGRMMDKLDHPNVVKLVDMAVLIKYRGVPCSPIPFSPSAVSLAV